MISHPTIVSDRPDTEENVDALSQVLESVHFHGSLYFRSELTAPWGMSVPASDTAQFHVVRRGQCWLFSVEPEAPPALRLEAGDIVVLPRGDAHVLADTPVTPAVPLQELVDRHLAQPHAQRAPLRFGGDGAGVTLICGYFRYDAGAVHPLLSVLPDVLHLSGEGGRARPWLETSLDLIAEEVRVGRPGAEAITNRLTEALFIQVIRAHIESVDQARPSWLAGLGDEQIAHGLGVMHAEVDRPWSVEALAHRVGMSRSGFSARFRELVGEPPLQYLTRWRMHQAATHLKEGRLSIAEIAAAVGYGAEASFSKVFKRFMGDAPGAYRRRIAADGSS